MSPLLFTFRPGLSKFSSAVQSPVFLISPIMNSPHGELQCHPHPHHPSIPPKRSNASGKSSLVATSRNSNSGSPALNPAGSPGQIPSQWEDRLCTSEARLEALQQTVQRLADSTREESESRTAPATRGDPAPRRADPASGRLKVRRNRTAGNRPTRTAKSALG